MNGLYTDNTPFAEGSQFSYQPLRRRRCEAGEGTDPTEGGRGGGAIKKRDGKPGEADAIGEGGDREVGAEVRPTTEQPRDHVAGGPPRATNGDG